MSRTTKKGHRQRLRDSFLSGKDSSASEEAILELLLTYAIPQKDVQTIAKELIGIFGSLNSVFSATQDELCKVKGIGKASVTLLKVIEFIRSGATPSKPRISLPKGVGPTQQMLFENTKDGKNPEQGNADLQNSKNEASTKQKQPVNQIEKPNRATSIRSVSSRALRHLNSLPHILRIGSPKQVLNSHQEVPSYE